MHVDQGILDRLLSGDIGPEDRTLAEDHLAACDECRELLEDREVVRLLTHLDEPAPDVSVAELMARAEQRRTPRHLRWAAGVLLTMVGAGAVYAAPGSPVRSWIEGLTRDVDVPVMEAPSEPQDLAGVVVPAGDGLEIELRPQTEGTIRVVLADVPEVSVEAANGPATFDSRADRLVVEGSRASDFRITIPRDAGSVDVLVGATSVFRLESGRIVSLVAPDAAGGYSVAFAEVR